MEKIEKKVLNESSEEEEDEKVVLIDSTSNFGNIFPDSKSFDDENFFGENILNFKISQIKIFHGTIDGAELVTGIQIYYRDRIKGTITTTGEFKSEKTGELYEELILEPNENLVDFQIRTGDKGVNNLEFKTNKGRTIKCGGNGGEQKITEFSNSQEKYIILGIFGGYSNCLNSFGVYFISKKNFIKILYGGLFNLRFILKKKNEVKKQILENKDKLNLEFYTILKVCLLPDSAFCSVMRYIMC